MSVMSVLALQNAAVLRAIDTTPAEQIPTVTALAALIGKDESNLRKTLKALNGDELVDVQSTAPLVIELAEKGRAFLAALARAESDPTSEAMPEGYVWLRHAQIRTDPDNARKHTGLSEISIAAMAESLRTKGMLQGPGVTPSPDEEGVWTLTMGERRYRGWGLNIERGDWPADKLILCKIEDGDPLDRMLKGLVENLQRSDITNLEMGEAFLQLTERHGQTAQQIAKDVDRTERFVQIAIKVAREATPEDKARYIESEQAYAHAKATGGEAKRDFTWEQLRSEVQTPRHVAALAKGDNLVVTLVELAHRAIKENGSALTWVEIQTPPGGGHWAHAETLGLIEDAREDGKTLARTTERAEKWLKDKGFYADPDAMLARIRVEAHGPMPEQIACEKGTYIIGFINPPKPKPEPVATPEETAEAEASPSPSVKEPHPEEATDDTITPHQALVLGEVLHKTRFKPHPVGDGLVAALLERAMPDLSVELRPLLWGGYLASGFISTMLGTRQFLRVTEQGERWLTARNLNPTVNTNNLYALQGGAKMQPPVSAVYALDWLNKPPAEADEAPKPSRDSFAEQIRQVNAEPAQPSAAEQALMQQLLDTKKEPEAEVEQPHGPGFKDLEWVALVELAHKINTHGVEISGGALIGAEVGNYQSGPAAAIAQALIHKRMIGFRPMPEGQGFLAYMTPAAMAHFEEEVDDAFLQSTHEESLPRAEIADFLASEATYATPWLNVETRSGEAVATTVTTLSSSYEEASADYAALNPPSSAQSTIAVDDYDAGALSHPDLDRDEEDDEPQFDIAAAFGGRWDYIVVAQMTSPITMSQVEPFGVIAKDEGDGYVIGETLAQSGRFSDVKLHTRHGRLLAHWGGQ
jgi:ParB/RepB/Spo0J family partition protein